MEHSDKWDRRFIELAKLISSWSKDPSTQAGAVITDNKRRVISMGYNGLAQGVEDLPERLNNREIKYKMFVHAERNAIIFARQSLENCLQYLYLALYDGRCLRSYGDSVRHHKSCRTA
jgi:dCMP deaminase